MNTRPNILFLSANKFGFEVFKHAQQHIDGNFYVMTLSADSSVKMYDSVSTASWKKHCSNVFEISSIRTESALDTLRSLDLDVIFLCGWRQILSKEILGIPPYGVISFHPTPLPKGRGPAPIINSILEGWSSSAVTMYFADSGVDSGDIIDQEEFDILEDDCAYDVYQKCIMAGKKLVEKNITAITSGRCSATPQLESEVSYLKKLTLRDNEIDLNDPPEYNERKIRALSYPYLGAYIVNGEKKIIIDKARLCTKTKKY